MKKTFSPRNSKDLKIINIINGDKDINYYSSLSKFIKKKSTNRNTYSKYNSHKTLNNLMTKKTKPIIKKTSHQFYHQPITVKNNNNEINIHLSFGSDSINNNTNNYSSNTIYSKGTNSYEDILKEKELVIMKLKKELLINRELINKIKSNYNINDKILLNNITNNNFISLSKTKSFGNITTKRKNKNEVSNFFNSILQNFNIKKNNGEFSLNNYRTNRGLSNFVYNSYNNENKGNYYNLNKKSKSKSKKKKTYSCEPIDKVKYLEKLFSAEKKKKKETVKDVEKEDNGIEYEDFKFLCDDIYDKTKNILEKYHKIISNKLLNKNQ